MGKRDWAEGFTVGQERVEAGEAGYYTDPAGWIRVVLYHLRSVRSLRTDRKPATTSLGAWGRTLARRMTDWEIGYHEGVLFALEQVMPDALTTTGYTETLNKEWHNGFEAGKGMYA